MAYDTVQTNPVCQSCRMLCTACHRAFASEAASGNRWNTSRTVCVGGVPRNDSSIVVYKSSGPVQLEATTRLTEQCSLPGRTVSGTSPWTSPHTPHRSSSKPQQPNPHTDSCSATPSQCTSPNVYQVTMRCCLCSLLQVCHLACQHALLYVCCSRPQVWHQH